jgi:hypothetical protein
MAIIKRDPITYQIAFSRMLKASKLKRYVLDWFTDILRHRSIDSHHIEKAELVITLSPDDIEAYASEVERYRETICIWSTEVFGKEATLHIATDGSTENEGMDIRLCLTLNEK